MSQLPDVILLCGFSGSGKTETGERLSKKLEYGFTDTDTTVEEVLGKSIPEIFMKLGESKFRFAESDVLRMAMKRKPHVIALGGGTIADQPSLEYVKEGGFLIYLRIKPVTIYERLKDSHLRPMLKSIDEDYQKHKDIIMERIAQLLEEREKYYSRANMIIETDDMTIDQVVEEITNRLRSER